MRPAGAAVLLVPLLAAGCQSFSTLGRARLVDPGRVEVWAAPEALAVATGSGASVRPVVEAGVRYGVSRIVELDAKLTTAGITLGPRLQLRRSALPTRGLDVALAPAVAYTYADKVALEVPVLFGINLPGRHQIILAPRLIWQMRLAVPGAPGPVHFLYAGLSLGIAVHVSPRVYLLPEIAALTSLYVDEGYSSNVTGAVGFQGGLGILFDP